MPPRVHFDWQSPNLNSFGAPLETGKQNGVSAAMNSGVNFGTRNVTMPVSSALPHMRFGHSNVPHGWFYCLPRFRQGFTPAPNFTTEDILHSGNVKGVGGEISPIGESDSQQKRFLVIDQTADQTTLIYSSRFGNPVDPLASNWDSKLHGSNNLNGNEPSRRDLNHLVGPSLVDKVDENQGTDIESEMREDTEEINALLYSDSDGYSTEDDEVTSTGHSPSTMTTHDNQEESYRGIPEEVASSAGRTKKRKLMDGAYDDMQFMDTASSQNRSRSFVMGDDDAESRCSSGINILMSGSFSGNKKMRKDKVQGVLSILQSMIPGGKDMDPVELIDEAIRCLKSLKLQAKALGLEAS
ncbi:hypothetical protein RIF29_16946 [Crotalaria pallida]|uniref:Uncharacterized protein n=1 Tax=Crotalaria pallida TaxID=3830 RepID=A0AAN9FG45_CROPI